MFHASEYSGRISYYKRAIFARLYLARNVSKAVNYLMFCNSLMCPICPRKAVLVRDIYHYANRKLPILPRSVYSCKSMHLCLTSLVFLHRKTH